MMWAIVPVFAIRGRAWLWAVWSRSVMPSIEMAYATWSLAKLRDHFLGRGTVVAISRETLCQILRAGRPRPDDTTHR
jgi:hypothetical protein